MFAVERDKFEAGQQMFTVEYHNMNTTARYNMKSTDMEERVQCQWPSYSKFKNGNTVDRENGLNLDTLPKIQTVKSALDLEDQKYITTIGEIHLTFKRTLGTT